MGELVKNKTQGYGYNYASLADFHRQGIEIPEMRVMANEFGEFVEYKDTEGNWHQGARIVHADLKGMNACQSYGSALTYARRYTVAMANGIATDDDENVEKAKPTKKSTGKSTSKVDFNEVWKKVDAIQSISELEQYWNSLTLTDAQQKVLVKSFKKRKGELNGVD